MESGGPPRKGDGDWEPSGPFRRKAAWRVRNPGWKSGKGTDRWHEAPGVVPGEGTDPEVAGNWKVAGFPERISEAVCFFFGTK